MQALELQQSTMLNSLRNCVPRIAALQQSVTALKSTAPTSLAAEVVDLREAVSKLAQTQRKFQGRFDATRQHESAPTNNGVDDDELAALLALQTAPPAGP